MISDRSDHDFKRWLDVLELTTPPLLASDHYGPILRARNAERQLEDARAEWRERQERARARALKYEASYAD